MIQLVNIVQALPPIKIGNELFTALEILPEYKNSIRFSERSSRLVALSDLYKIYIPSQMSSEIYSKLYLALLPSLQKKGTALSVQQHIQNFKAISKQEYQGIMGGSDSFSIIGASGIGRSSAISRAIQLITADQILEADNPYTKIIPFLCVQCPFDSSVKGLLLEILRKVDENLGSKYYQYSSKTRITIDTLIGTVSQVSLNHIGVLIVDEIQNVCFSKNGRNLVGMLTQLINNSGISICMVGTPESEVFFEQAMQLARRSLGLRYEMMEYGEEFRNFCTVLCSYQYVKKGAMITDGIIKWLYEHSAGNISAVVTLIHDAQEISILNGRELLDVTALNEAYQKRLSMLHSFIHPSLPKEKSSAKSSKEASVPPSKDANLESEYPRISISELVEKSNLDKSDIVQLLKANMPIEEVSV